MLLDNRDGTTNLQVMHVKKSIDQQNINLSVDNMVYISDMKENTVRNEGTFHCNDGKLLEKVYIWAKTSINCRCAYPFSVIYLMLLNLKLVLRLQFVQ